MPRNISYIDGTITVSSGAGQAYALINYPHPINILRLVAINAPTDAAQFDLLIRDAGGYLLYKELAFVGDTSISMGTFTKTDILLRLENVSVEGAYAFRIYLEN